MADISSNMFESLLKQVQDYTPEIEAVEVGYVEEIGDGIARVAGLSNIRYSDFFIDVMYAPIFHLTDFKSNGVTYNVKYDKTTSFGWRIGGFSRHPKEQGFSFKWELGSRPGFKSDPSKSVPVNVKNMYFMMTMGLYVPLKVKPIYMGDQ